jgi:hypothetical protein
MDSTVFPKTFVLIYQNTRRHCAERLISSTALLWKHQISDSPCYFTRRPHCVLPSTHCAIKLKMQFCEGNILENLKNMSDAQLFVRTWTAQSSDVRPRLYVKVKVKPSLYRPLALKAVQDPRICRELEHEDGEFVSPTHQPPLPHRWYHRCLFPLETE